MSILQKTILMAFLCGLGGCAGPNKTKIHSHDATVTKPNIEVVVNEEAREASELDLVLPQLNLKLIDGKESKAEYIKNNYVLDSSAVIELEISRKGYTRFSIEEERITDVFIYPQEAVQTRIHDQGYLIIVPDQQYTTSNEKIYVTITGEQGTTQDFSLHFTGKAPTPVKFIKPMLEQKFDKLGE